MDILRTGVGGRAALVIIGRISRGYEKGGLWNIAFYSLSHRQVGGLLRAIFHAEYAPLPESTS